MSDNWGKTVFFTRVSYINVILYSYVFLGRVLSKSIGKIKKGEVVRILAASKKDQGDVVGLNSIKGCVEREDLKCAHCCNGLINNGTQEMKCQETLGDIFFQTFHHFYLEHPGVYQIIFLDDQGQFISCLGDKQLCKELKKRGIVPGVSWVSGCENPLLVSIREGRPLCSIGPQKNCSLFHSFSILSFPFYSDGETGGLVGVLSPSESLIEELFPKIKELMEKTEQELNYFSSTDLLTGTDSLEKYLASLVHELKNPLMLIRGNAQLGKMLATPLEKDKKFTKILQEVDSLINTLDNMLVMYKKNQVEYSQNNLHQLLEDVLGVIEAELALKEIVLEKQFLARHFVFDFHYNLIRQAFLNLVSNGISVMENGGTLSIQTRNPNDDLIQIIFQDTGSGIEEKELSRIFLPFYSTREEGTGLGLAIVKKIIVQDHGGSIKVDSKLGEGATFSIAFSLKESD